MEPDSFMVSPTLLEELLEMENEAEKVEEAHEEREACDRTRKRAREAEVASLEVCKYE
ncbi:hypothetical protein Ciccas_014077, partial [Cichlidogyrus casuarinus]